MIEETYQALCKTESDIYQHLPKLKEYAEKSDSIVELGVRTIVSTWALLAGKPKWMLSIDIKHPMEYGADVGPVERAAQEQGTLFFFAMSDSLKVNLPDHDLLFIDTLHTYEQLAQELERHSPKTRKYILMHDTNLEEFPGMRKAIEEFLDNNTNWIVAEQFESCHGLTCLKRV